MKDQKVFFYSGTAWLVVQHIDKEIHDGWSIVSMVSHDNKVIVVYEKAKVENSYEI